MTEEWSSEREPPRVILVEGSLRSRRNERIRVYAVQVSNTVQKHQPSKPEALLKYELAALKKIAEEEAGTRRRPLCFVLFPEVSVTRQSLPFLTRAIADECPPGVYVLGLEHLQRKEYLAVADEMGAIRHDDFHENKREDWVNSCLILLRTENGSLKAFLQPKLTVSKAEATARGPENIYTGDFYYLFEVDGVRFSSIICSDFFERPDGMQNRIIDEMEHELMANKPLDFLFGVLHTPDTDDLRFRHSIGRLYDDGTYTGDLCVFLANAVTAHSRWQDEFVGGRSKMMLWKGRHEHLEPFETVKATDMPVVGYELPPQPALARWTFKRLPRKWSESADWAAVPVDYFLFRDEKWEQQDPAETVTYLRHVSAPLLEEGSYADVATELARRGEYQRAVALLQSVEESLEKAKKFEAAARAAHDRGSMYRHMGELRRAQECFNHEGTLIEQAFRHTKGQGLELLEWRNRAANIMLGKELLRGQHASALTDIRLLLVEIESWLRAHPRLEGRARRACKHYLLHGRRFEADLLRYLGDYAGSQDIYRHTLRRYDYPFAEERAYCYLGIGDTSRLLGDFAGAWKYYGLAGKYGQAKSDKRFSARILRNTLVLRHAEGALADPDDEDLKKLRSLSVETDYRFGFIYSRLIAGMLLLAANPRAAEQEFAEGRKLCEDERRGLICTEGCHCLFGMGEARRIGGDFDEATVRLSEAQKRYREYGIEWGKTEVTRALRLAKSSSTAPSTFANFP